MWQQRVVVWSDSKQSYHRYQVSGARKTFVKKTDLIGSRHLTGKNSRAWYNVNFWKNPFVGIVVSLDIIQIRPFSDNSVKGNNVNLLNRWLWFYHYPRRRWKTVEGKGNKTTVLFGGLRIQFVCCWSIQRVTRQADNDGWFQKTLFAMAAMLALFQTNFNAN